MITNEWIEKVNDVSRNRRIKQLKVNSNKEYWYKEKVPQKIKDDGIIESNTIIAKFMGYGVDDSHQFFYGIHYYKMNDDSDKTYDQLTIENVRSYTEGFVYNYIDMIERRYDNHWDILMPVIKKISETDEVLQLKLGELMSDCKFEILPVWQSIVKYLKRKQ